ncbi:TRAP transporter substrate-binding protein [Paracoccus alkenifer]|uniref:TRAP-type C4-dicarboxylate transport system, substrate-binding protein n=1 Tax=Paracoccus alkenifer TaxID=65735 RepID=A0A1H6NB56_9RHOB|nr:TRAP transporter substrate-binding protein [Paracoccus alkenifer]SEI12169.1 TRAP-type C4-dicarboxylate transport system, substrate-binding protein [Paracoccus alkenifer]
MSYFNRAGILTGALLATCGATAQAQDVTLHYSNWLPAGYALDVELMEPWIAEIERVTEGRVKIQKTTKVVGSVAAQYDVVAEGMADMSLMVLSYTPGRFPLVEGMELPFASDDESRTSPAVWATYEKYLADTDVFRDVVPIGLFQTGVFHVFTTGRDLSIADNWKGAKLRSSSPSLTRIIELMGGSPVSKPVSEVYELASGRMIDGATTPPDALLGFKLDDVLHTMTFVPGSLGSTTVLVSVNPDAWAKISEPDQQAIRQVSGAAVAKMSGDLHRKETEAAIAKMQDDGRTIHRMSAAELAKMQALVAPLTAEWLEKAKTAGMENPQEMLDFFRAELNRTAQ